MLWLSSMVHLTTSRKLNSLLAYFESAANIFHASENELASACKDAPSTAELIRTNRSLQTLDAFMSQLENDGISYISQSDAAFPELLLNIPDPPIGLFFIGSLPDESMPKVAIIGSRQCSEYGLMAARLFAKPLAECGVVIVSGMAKGVDSMAHKGALDGKGKTIAVLGCGVDICYPKENKALREQIINNGCFMSEYMPGVNPLPYYFPARNRIISGLSLGVVVTEASEKSGTLITVTQASEQGREVMAVPGNILSALSKGTNHLIRDGAAPVSDYTDILYVLGLNSRLKTDKKTDNLTISTENLALDEKQVYNRMSFEPISFDMLCEQTGLEARKIHLITTQLELKSLIKRLPGSRYIKNI